MKIRESSIAPLSLFLSQRLVPICSAEPSILVSYILAMLNADTTVEALKTQCEEGLEEFLNNATKPFVEELFSVLHFQPESQDFIFHTSETSSAEQTTQQFPVHSLELEEGLIPDSPPRDVDSDTKRHRRNTIPVADTTKYRSRDSEDSRRNPRRKFDKITRYLNISSRRQQQQQQQTQGRGFKKTRERCKDYEGFCLRGEYCPYDHGDDRIIVKGMDDLNQLGGSNTMPDLNAAVESLSNPVEPYDPESPTYMNNNLYVPNLTESTYEDVVVPIRSAPNQGRGEYKRKERKRREEEAPNPSQTMLVVKNIPSELNVLENLLGHFKTFGNVVNIQVRQHQNKAIVQFESHDAALTAVNSPEPVFGNRSIYVEWARKNPKDRERDRERENRTKKEKKQHYAPVPTKATFTPSGNLSLTLNRTIDPTISGTPKPVIPTYYPSQSQHPQPSYRPPSIAPKPTVTTSVATSSTSSTKKAKLEQTKHLLEQLEKMKPKLSAEEFATMTKRIGVMIQNITAESEKSQILSEKNASEILVKRKTLEPGSTTTSATMSSADESQTLDTDSAETQKLKETLAELQQVAASMGIDPATAVPSATPHTIPAKKSIPQKTTFNKFAPKKGTFVLDRRPSSLKLTMIPEELKTKDALFAHFKQFGNVTSVQFSNQNDVGLVVFATRRDAEEAMKKGKMFKAQPLQSVWEAEKNIENLQSKPEQEDSSSLVASSSTQQNPEDSQTIITTS